jgi:hypothetical protein
VARARLRGRHRSRFERVQARQPLRTPRHTTQWQRQPRRFIVQREYRPGLKGRIAAAVNHLGGRRLFGWYLGTALRALEKRIAVSD